jgi:hypothetical protein
MENHLSNGNNKRSGKIVYRMGENISKFTNYSSNKGFISKMHKDFK